MKTKVKQAVLKILLLQEEFSQKELREAIEYIANNRFNNIRSLLLTSCSSEDAPSKMETNSVPDGLSRNLEKLKANDLEKYELLSKLHTSLREGEMSPKLAAIKKVGSSYSKDFAPGKSRRVAIPRLIALLSSMPVEQVREAIKKIISETGSDSSEYADLASYLIYGHDQNKNKKTF